MENFQYTYLTFKEAMSKIIYIIQFWPEDYTILLFSIWIIFYFTYYYFPFIYINKEKVLEKINQSKKRDFIKKIWLQREIEEEIEREIEKESLLKYAQK
jgi:hypothetical protein